jgi:hypothetical protein
MQVPFSASGSRVGKVVSCTQAGLDMTVASSAARLMQSSRKSTLIDENVLVPNCGAAGAVADDADAAQLTSLVAAAARPDNDCQ